MAETVGRFQTMKSRKFQVELQTTRALWRDPTQHQPLDKQQHTAIGRNYIFNEKRRYPPPTAKYVGCWDPFFQSIQRAAVNKWEEDVYSESTRIINWSESVQRYGTNCNIDSTFEKRPDRPSQWGDFSKAQVRSWWTDEWATGQWTGAWVQGGRIRRMRVSLRLAITGPPAAASSSISSLAHLTLHFVFVFVSCFLT